jgi:hypothetical protein
MTIQGPSRVVIIGAGGFGGETASLIVALSPDNGAHALGFLDGAQDPDRTTVAGLPGAANLDDVKFTISVGDLICYDAK